ncbi:MAG: hypothetical protein KID04_13255 [Clostridium sp.]|nr:hypothetical protein [Clostridium sp.]
MTIHDMLEFFRQDEELRQMILTNPEAMGRYHPKNYPGRKIHGTEAGIATRHFWENLAGAKFRYAVEQKTGVLTRRYKDAVSLFIAEVRRDAGIDD